MCRFHYVHVKKKKKKEKERKKPIYQIKLCKLHSDVARVPAPPSPSPPQWCGIFTFSSSVQDGAKIEKNDASSYKAELNEISLSINRHPGCVWWEVLAAFFPRSEFSRGFPLLSETSTVTAIACPLLCSQSCYSGPFLLRAVVFVVLLDKTEREPDIHHILPFSLSLCCQSVAPAWGHGSWSNKSGEFFFNFLLLPLLVRTALSAVWAWRRRSPWDPGWWRSRWPEARRSASASGTWAGAAAGPGSWTVLTRSAAERQKGLENLSLAKRESNKEKTAVFGAIYWSKEAKTNLPWYKKKSCIKK